MNWKKITGIFVVAVIAIILVYDVIAYVNGGTASTISFTIFEWSYKYPAFTFAMGFVMGHLFWQMKGTAKVLNQVFNKEDSGGEDGQ